MMSGMHNNMTQQMDVYAFAICFVEILDMGGCRGSITTTLLSSGSYMVRLYLMLVCIQRTSDSAEENKRPKLPHARIISPALVGLMDMCWARDPQHRPPFKKVAPDLKQLRLIAGSHIKMESPAPRHNELFPENEHMSPGLAPVPLPGTASAFSIYIL